MKRVAAGCMRVAPILAFALALLGCVGQAARSGKNDEPAASSDAVKTVTTFYTRAANDDFKGAWALGTDKLHAQFPGGFHTFKATVATLESIEFPTIEATDPNTVEFTSIARHTNRTDRCNGTATLVEGMIDHLSVQCGPE